MRVDWMTDHGDVIAYVEIGDEDGHVQFWLDADLDVWRANELVLGRQVLSLRDTVLNPDDGFTAELNKAVGR